MTDNFAPGATPVASPSQGRKNWFLGHKAITAVGAVILFGTLTSIANSSDTKTITTAPVAEPAAVSTPPDQAALDKTASAKAAAAKAAAGVYDETYGTLTTVVKSGRGDALIALPKGVKAGMVTATHQGSSNFQISGLDKSNQSTIDGLVNEIGNYSGSTAYGLIDLGEAPVKLQVTADGSWTIKIAPISSARVLPTSISGKGDAVFKFDGDAADFAIRHKGSSNFQVQQYGGDLSMGVNEIGKYSGTVPFVAGPTVLVIVADGAWTLKRQG